MAPRILVVDDDSHIRTSSCSTSACRRWTGSRSAGGCAHIRCAGAVPVRAGRGDRPGPRARNRRRRLCHQAVQPARAGRARQRDPERARPAAPEPAADRQFSRAHCSSGAGQPSASFDGKAAGADGDRVLDPEGLSARPTHVFSRDAGDGQRLWPAIHVADRTIDSHIRNIRAKLAAVGCLDARSRPCMASASGLADAADDAGKWIGRKWRPNLSHGRRRHPDHGDGLAAGRPVLLPALRKPADPPDRGGADRARRGHRRHLCAGCARRRLPGKTRRADAGRQAGIPAEPANRTREYRPIEPQARSRRATACRPGRRRCRRPADPAFAAIGARLSGILDATQKTTLAGFRLLDPRGVVIAGRGEVGQSLAHVEEVRDCAAGRYASALRLRMPRPAGAAALFGQPRHQGACLRRFAGHPVDGQVAGVVYVSRTPNNIIRHLYGERGKVVLAASPSLGGTLLIGLAFHRTVSRPIYALIDRTSDRPPATARRSGRSTITAPPRWRNCPPSFLDMAEKPEQARSDFIADFRHPCLA
jgi:hypothetical protein